MKIPLFIITCVCLLSFKPMVETDYEKVFGNKYTWAVSWLQQNDLLIREYASDFNIPEKELKAIVFPELIRYNSFFNTLEIESLKYLYVKEGKDYADFSVGFFQMKPSFGESIEVDARNLLPGDYLERSGWKAVQKDNEVERQERVRRLSNVRHQLIYLCAFYKFCEFRFKDMRFSSPEERVKLFATCYNAGYRRSYESLLSFSAKNNFYRYNYSSVSMYYYQHE